MIKITVENDCIRQEASGTKIEIFGECMMTVFSIVNLLEKEMPFFNADVFYKTVEEERKNNKGKKTATLDIPSDKGLRSVLAALFDKEE